MKTLIFSLFLFAFGCSATVSESLGSENDAGEAADTTPVQTDQPPTDAAVAADAPAPTDASASDTGPIQPTIRLSPVSPPARTVPPNSTGVLLGVFDIIAGEALLPIRGFRVRRVGVGTPTDFNSLFAYLVPSTSASNEPFRYTLGHGINPSTQMATIRYYGNLRPRWTATVYLYGDLAPGTPGGQHAFELTEVLTEDGTVPGVAVRSQAITIGTRRATRIDIRRVTTSETVPTQRPRQIIASFDAIVGENPAELGNLALTHGGASLPPVPFRDFELWLGDRRIEIDTSVGINDNQLVLTPITPIALAARSTNRFTVRATVIAEAGTHFQIHLEYPSDLRMRDVVLGEAAAVCISSLRTPGCDGPGQGSYDGTGGNANIFRVTN